MVLREKLAAGKNFAHCRAGVNISLTALWKLVRSASGVWRAVLVSAPQVLAARTQSNLLSMFDFDLIQELCGLPFGINGRILMNLCRICSQFGSYLWK